MPTNEYELQSESHRGPFTADVIANLIDCGLVPCNVIVRRRALQGLAAGAWQPADTVAEIAVGITEAVERKKHPENAGWRTEDGGAKTQGQYFCPHCRVMVEVSTKPKRSFLGFLRIPCRICNKEISRPLSTGYVVFYWLVLSMNILWVYTLLKGGTIDPNPIGILLQIGAIVGLVKNAKLRRDLDQLMNKNDRPKVITPTPTPSPSIGNSGKMSRLGVAALVGIFVVAFLVVYKSLTPGDGNTKTIFATERVEDILTRQFQAGLTENKQNIFNDLHPVGTATRVTVHDAGCPRRR